jgi:hypothetical protein
MPLKRGSSEKTISRNIRELHKGETFAHTKNKFGKARADKQAVAIALDEASKGYALGGGVGPLASQAFNPVAAGVAAPLRRGGVPEITPMKPVKIHKGPIISTVPGRTDKHFTHVPSGSFVVPADIVSGHGEGNTLAGSENLQKMFKMGPYGTGKPMPIKAKKFARGGLTPQEQHVGKPVPVKLAGGELVIPPENVHETMQRLLGKPLSLDQSHEAMDRWVVDERRKLRGTLASLPPPAKD